VKWILARQGADGQIAGEFKAGRGWAHAICGMALAEAYGTARNPMVGRAAQKALDYSVEAQTERSGWGRALGAKPDLSTTGWYLQQMGSAKLAGLMFPREVITSAAAFLDTVTKKDALSAGQCSMVPGGKATPSMTAVGMLARLRIGVKPNDPAIAGAADHLASRPPAWTTKRTADFHYWYYGTTAMFQVGGQRWKTWNRAFRDMLVQQQRRGGDEDGSWDPYGPGAGSGGRVYSTAMGVMCLEVYYRYPPPPPGR